MAEYLIQDTTLDAIANAIHNKSGATVPMTPAEMATEIAAIPTGGGSITPVIVTIATGGTNNVITNQIRNAIGEQDFFAINLTETVPADSFHLFGGVILNFTSAGVSCSVDCGYRKNAAGAYGSAAMTATGSTYTPSGTQFEVYPLGGVFN